MTVEELLQERLGGKYLITCEDAEPVHLGRRITHVELQGDKDDTDWASLTFFLEPLAASAADSEDRWDWRTEVKNNETNRLTITPITVFTLSDTPPPTTTAVDTAKGS